MTDGWARLPAHEGAPELVAPAIVLPGRLVRGLRGRGTADMASAERGAAGGSHPRRLRVDLGVVVLGGAGPAGPRDAAVRFVRGPSPPAHRGAAPPDGFRGSTRHHRRLCADGGRI